MQNWIKRPVFALLASIGLGLVLIGCSSSVPEPPEATQHSEETQTENYSDYDLKWYDPRDDIPDPVSNVGTAIASAIDAGDFGAIKRYDQQMKEISADYDGWGTISAQDNKVFAEVWWDHSEIDYTKSIPRVGMFDEDNVRYELLSADASMAFWHVAEISRDGRPTEDYTVVYLDRMSYEPLIAKMERLAQNARP